MQVLALLVVQRIARGWGRQIRRFVTIVAFVLFSAMFVVYLVIIGHTASAGFTDVVRFSTVLGTTTYPLSLHLHERDIIRVCTEQHVHKRVGVQPCSRVLCVMVHAAGI